MLVSDIDFVPEAIEFVGRSWVSMKSILVIDDDGPIRQAVRTLLRKRGYEVLEAASGNTGIELARAKLPDLILSDVDMPGLDGFDVLKALLSEPTTSPFRVS